MIKHLYHIFLQILQLVLSTGAFTLVIVILCNIILYLIYRRKLNITSYKITNFYLSYFYACIYISFFVLYLLLLRASRIGNSVDLYELYTVVITSTSLSKVNYITVIAVIIFICLLWLILFFRLTRLLLYHVKKLHLYYNNTSKRRYLQTGINVQPNVYEKAIQQFQNFYALNHYIFSLQQIICRIVRNISNTYFPQYYKRCNDLLITYIIKSSLLYAFFRYFMFSLLLVLFVYDCYFNNFVIEKVFYYLPIYFLFLMWYTVSFFLYNTSHELDSILFEMYYCEPLVIYVNLTPEYEEELQLYIKQGLRQYKIQEEDFAILFYKMAHYFEFRHPILRNCQFFRVENDAGLPESIGKVIYVNLERTKYFDLTDIIVIGEKYFVRDTL